MLEFFTGGLLAFGATQWLFLIFLGVFGYFCWQDWKRQQKYAHLPGPTSLPLVGNLFQFLMQDLDVLHFGCEVVQRFNGFCRIVNGNKIYIIITDPDHLKQFYTNPNMLDRTEHYEYVAQGIGEGSLFVANGERWKQLRKMLMLSFQPTPIDVLFDNCNKIYAKFRPILMEKANGTVFPCRALVKNLLATASLANLVGEPFPEEKVAPVVEAFAYWFHMGFARQVSMYLRFDPIFYCLPAGWKFRNCRNICEKFAVEIIQMKRAELAGILKNGGEVPNLYIFNLLQQFGEESDLLLAYEFSTMFITSWETVGMGICFMLEICGLYPEIQDRIREEDRDILNSLRGNPLTVDDLVKYEYLGRVIKETQRMFPFTPVIGKKAGEDTYFGKHFVPKGTDMVGISIITHRNPEFFPDPLKFDPDRFLPENVEKTHPFAFNPFSYGPRSCPGTRYAVIALKAIFPAILRDFVVESRYATLEELFDNVRFDITLNDKNSFPIKLIKRNQI